MTERKYLQVNLDTDTLPTSSVTKDVDGNPLAKLSLSLSSNLIGNLAGGKLPSKVEFKVTKMSVPVSNVPFCYAPFRTFAEQGVESQAMYVVLPYVLDGEGRLVRGANALYTPVMFVHEDYIRPQRLVFPFRHTKDVIDAARREVMANGSFEIQSVYDIVNSLNKANKDIFASAIPVGFDRLEYRFEDDKFKIATFSREENQGLGPMPNNPFLERLENQSFPSGSVLMRDEFWPHLQTQENLTMLEGNLNWSYDVVRHPYSICGNQALRDMLSSLPWVRVDTRGIELPYDWSMMNDGDPYIYVLDTMKTSFKINTSVAPYVFTISNNQSAARQTAIVKNSPELVLTFDDVNPVSFSNITSFVLMTSGLDATQQVFPVNITANSDAATQIPVLEVYHPLWQNISDMSDRVLIDKEQFTNQPLFMTNNYSSICERNITFQLYNVRSGGKLYPLTIRPGTRFCLQLTFALYY